MYLYVISQNTCQNTFLKDENPKGRLDDILNVEILREVVARLIGRKWNEHQPS